MHRAYWTGHNDFMIEMANRLEKKLVQKEALSAEAVPQKDQYKRESENLRIRNAELEVMLNAYREMLDKEAVQGEWIRVGHDIYECSLCHQHVMTKDIDCYSFCHRCGAKMNGGDSE